MPEKATVHLSVSWSVMTAALGAMTLNEWALLIGIAGTILTTLGTLAFRWRRDRREQRAFEIAEGTRQGRRRQDPCLTCPKRLEAIDD